MSDIENKSTPTKASKLATKTDEKPVSIRKQPTDAELEQARAAARPANPKQVKARTAGSTEMWDPDAGQHVTTKLGLLEDSAWLRRQEKAGKVVIEA